MHENIEEIKRELFEKKFEKVDQRRNEKSVRKIKRCFMFAWRTNEFVGRQKCALVHGIKRLQ